ncbi:MAG: hypothetical protein ACREIA_00715 [Opitutaceae bacterium]
MTCFRSLSFSLRTVVLLLAVAGAFFSAGCTRTYNVKVDAIHNPSVVGGHSYKIVPRQQGFEERDPDYAQAVALLKNALGGRGMYEAPNPDEAEVIVEVDYGVGPLRTEIQTERGMMPMSTASAVVQQQMNPHRRYGRMGPNSVILPDGRIAEPIVEEDTVRAKQVYDKHLSISAREVAVDENGVKSTGKELWRVEVEVEDKKDDMAEALPILVGAASDYIDANTGSQQVIRVSEDAESVVFVKGTRQ